MFLVKIISQLFFLIQTLYFIFAYMRIAIITLLVFIVSNALSQSPYRNIDGSNNNLLNSDWGMIGGGIMQYTDNAYEDSVSMPSGSDRPNPRLISNNIFDQNAIMDNPYGLSDFIWNFGQFLDHDITLVEEGHSEFYPVYVPMGDTWFDPSNSGTAMIPMMRSFEKPGTGTSSSNPRQQMNGITAWIDASAVYGSDNSRANWLRSFVDGKLKVSEGDLLPYNTITGEFADAIDPTAPNMANAGTASKYFVAGDVRANEQPGLTCFHTLFVREHNRLCDVYKSFYPGLTDEELYQKSRRMVIAIIQKITFDDWLPALGVNLDPYSGYDNQVNPQMLNVFSSAAYRLGHTMIGSEIHRVGGDWDELAAGTLQLKDAYFAPYHIRDHGISAHFRGMLIQDQQDIDTKVISDLRNFLFGAPGSGGLDLVSLNINRGRDHGLADYNSIRQDLGLSPIANFASLTSDAGLATTLQNTYGTIDKLDPWVGMLSEDHMPGYAFGETIAYIMKMQFGNLRDGDRYYYLNDANLSSVEIDYIQNCKLKDVIERNTFIEIPKNNVFFSWDPDAIVSCDLPSNLNSVPGFNTADLSWNAVPGATSYLLEGSEIGGDLFQFTFSSNAITANSLEEGKTYVWRVKAFCSNGDTSIYSDFDTFTNLNCNEPINLQASNISFNSAELSWEEIEGVDGYLLYGGTDLNFPMSTYISGASNTTFTATGLASNQLYNWVIMAQCEPGMYSDLSSMAFFNTLTATSKTADLSATAEVLVFPNPSNGKFWIRANEEIESVIVYSMLGQEVMRMEDLDQAQQVQIDLENRSKGQYIVELRTGQNTHSQLITVR